MIRINPSSINDLLALKDAGAPVTLTSHPGNASLYKLTLWQCGIPEHLWDVTCSVADANNQPMMRLVGGQAEPLVSPDLFEKIKRETGPTRRFVTAYQYAKNGERLGRIHVREMQKCFPDGISSCSRLLLSEVKLVREVFEYLAETRPHTVFARFITPEGVLMPISESGLRAADMTESFIGVLRELDHLLFSDSPLKTDGGACYDGVMIQLATMLAQYWRSGRVDRYDISGPDMINYSSAPAYQEELSEMLTHLRRWNPRIIPPAFSVRMFPGTVARVGYIPGHASEGVMMRKLSALQRENIATGEEKQARRKAAQHDEGVWPTKIQPSKDCYFSQHDLSALGGSLAVDEFWKTVPLDKMWDTLHRANALLRLQKH